MDLYDVELPCTCYMCPFGRTRDLTPPMLDRAPSDACFFDRSIKDYGRPPLKYNMIQRG
jgi:hypothetical protein